MSLQESAELTLKEDINGAIDIFSQYDKETHRKSFTSNPHSTIKVPKYKMLSENWLYLYMHLYI
jgi:hypothetical protein